MLHLPGLQPRDKTTSEKCLVMLECLDVGALSGRTLHECPFARVKARTANQVAVSELL